MYLCSLTLHLLCLTSFSLTLTFLPLTLHPTTVRTVVDLIAQVHRVRAFSLHKYSLGTRTQLKYFFDMVKPVSPEGSHVCVRFGLAAWDEGTYLAVTRVSDDVRTQIKGSAMPSDHLNQIGPAWLHGTEARTLGLITYMTVPRHTRGHPGMYWT